MGIVSSRVFAASAFLQERLTRGMPEETGPLDHEALFILDGVGGFQLAPALVRRVLRRENVDIGTIVFKWQCWLRGEIFTDLCWLRRNQLMGRKLARRLLAFRREHPTTKIHLLAYSGGAGIAVFACEQLNGRRIVDTLALACPAIWGGYNLGPALRAVNRAYALVSERDSAILGLGTRLFGTTDRRHKAAAGMTGFHIPASASTEDRAAYARFRELHWTPELRRLGHHGGHTAWAGTQFLAAHLRPLLRGEPRLPAHCVAETTADASAT